jgi:ribose-phosphate pyrophosphokinase
MTSDKRERASLDPIEVVSTKRLSLFAGRSSPELAEEIAAFLECPLGTVENQTFAGGEIHSRFLQNVRGTDAFVLQCMSDPLNDHLMEHWIMIDALRRASAKRITAVTPYYPYARQDKKALSREPITARLVANMYEAAGIDRIISVDLHAGQIQGFHSVPLDHLTALPVLCDYVSKNIDDDAQVTIVSPDTGRVRTAEKFGQRLHEAPIAFLHKKRSRETVHEIEMLEVVGDVQGRTCVVVDDMIDTAGTICSAAQMLVERGAASVWAVATHGVFSDLAIDRLKNAPFERVVVTNTLPIAADHQFDSLVVLSIAPVIARAIRAIFEDESVSKLSEGENEKF